ncbi:NAD(P)-binding domain-containing protein [Halomonas kalidii]|uniref:NAD(P)-binding domain-containing protein n=1 Tax=Halomonas kalidii TaxID=3043293 RepID=A0ABT6VQZ9_9GAMM|nr:NAD(P)-binding domain-containing protein [Halomonas kalidii]MDI5936412.1 NAD(P)-binding domain-containing protein [Halomonas kalidii]
MLGIPSSSLSARMNDFISILPLVAPLDRDGLRRLAIHACLELHRVRWRRCYLADDGTRMLCWYQARDAESVRLVLRQQGAAGTPVWPAEAMGAAVRESPTGDSDRVLVELSLEGLALDGLDSSDIAPTTSALLDALATAGAVVIRTFLSRHHGRLICLVEGGDTHGVTQCLGTAGIVPTSVWRCTELDPEPPGLFASQFASGAAHCGTVVQEVHRPVSRPELLDLDAVIIGAGLSGICALERLNRMGLRARVYEGGSEVGGVWHWNRYPGARVDSEIHTYGFSFSDALLRDWEWQELFPTQPDIARYLRHVVDRFGLRRHIRLGTPVLTATFDEAEALWRIETGTGERVAARYLIAATGTLSVPQLPDYPGMSDFSGESFHTARWPAGVELGGKRVGVIGTGASGVQVIQTIAPDVAHLTVFQRTPTYCIPQRNRPLTDADRREIRRDWTRILATCRESYGGFIHTFDPRSGLAVSAAEREAKFEELWQKAGFAFWFGNFADLMMNFEVNEHACDFLRRKIQARVHDPETARRLLPSHPFGTKRVPLENGYYETYNRGNVALVDLRETPIERITPGGIRTSRDEHPLDVIVYATGFDAGTGSLSRIDIRGAGGLSLAEKWQAGPKTFLGLLVSGFPNLFSVNGPHNAAALCNAGRCIEQNVDWIVRCIEWMRRQGATRVVPTPVAEEEWTRHVLDVADASVLAAMRDSWFFGANTPGKPRVVTIYAAGAREYRQHCEAVANAGFAGLELS